MGSRSNLLEHPKRALADGIIVTPTLIRLSPPPIQRMVGDLSDRAQVLLTLGNEVSVRRGLHAWPRGGWSKPRGRSRRSLGQIDAIFEASGETPLLPKAQEALHASEEQYRQIVETTTDGIIKLDIEERMVFLNRRFAEMLCYEPVDIVGKSVYADMSAAATALMTASVLRRRAGSQDALDTTLRHKDGSEIAVNIVASSMLNGDGQYVGNLGVVRDVTERTKLQAQLMVSDRMASVGTLAAGVAHDIKNPLSAVIGNLDFVI